MNQVTCIRSTQRFNGFSNGNITIRFQRDIFTLADQTVAHWDSDKGIVKQKLYNHEYPATTLEEAMTVVALKMYPEVGGWL